jgi:hypothetical protein
MMLDDLQNSKHKQILPNFAPHIEGLKKQAASAGLISYDELLTVASDYLKNQDIIDNLKYRQFCNISENNLRIMMGLVVLQLTSILVKTIYPEDISGRNVLINRYGDLIDEIEKKKCGVYQHDLEDNFDEELIQKFIQDVVKYSELPIFLGGDRGGLNFLHVKHVMCFWGNCEQEGISQYLENLYAKVKHYGDPQLTEFKQYLHSIDWEYDKERETFLNSNY